MVCGIDIIYSDFILTTGGCISMACLAVIFVIFYYYKVPNLRRHPTMNAVYYTGWVYTIAIIMAIILVSVTPIKYGLSTDPMIWVRDAQDKTNWVKIAMFYLYMFIIYVYCGIIAWWSRNQISKGLEETMKVRKYSVSKQTKYVIGYFIFWTLVFAFELLNYFKTDFELNFMSTHDENVFRTISAFLLASRGMWSLGIFLLANWNEIRGHFFPAPRLGTAGGADHARTTTATNTSLSNRNFISADPPPNEEQELVQLNIALQKEIVRFTGLGIQKAVREIDEILQAQSSASRSTGTGNIFFNTRMPGDCVSFVVIDPDVNRRNLSTASSNSSVDNRGLSRRLKVPQYQDPVNPLLARNNSGRSDTGASTVHYNSPVTVPAAPAKQTSRKLQAVQEGKEDDDTEDLEAQKGRESSVDQQQRQRGYVSEPDNADHINFHMENKRMERQYSDTSAGRSSANITDRLFNSFSLHRHQQRNNFMFTDYSPKIFAQIRALSGVRHEDYIASFRSTTLPQFSEGKSGAFLYFSSDHKYIVKTTNQSEFEMLLQLLPEYERYLADESKSGHKSLLTRYLGAHRIVMYDIPLYFVVMLNILPSVDEKYDLKGSWVNRHGNRKNKDVKNARPKKFSSNTAGVKASAPLFLDNDLQNCFLLRTDVGRRVVKQIGRDISFLERFNLMDYSLLIGVRRRNFEVHDSSQQTVGVLTEQNLKVVEAVNSINPFHQDEDGAFHAAVVEGQGTFYIGIIDILQQWNLQKRLERFFKTVFLRKDGNGLSAIKPHAYRERFFQRAVLDVFDGVEDITLDDLTSDMGSVTSPVGSRHTIGAGGLGVMSQSSISMDQVLSEPEHRETSLFHESMGDIKTFSSISRMDSVDEHKKIRGTDARFTVTPLSR